MPSPVGRAHGKAQVPTIVWLDRYAEATPGVEVLDGATTILGWKSEPQPDALLRILPEYGGQTRDERAFVRDAPELVVEVARSSRHYDLKQKKADYERAGVREYLVVELDPNRIHWFIRRGDHFKNMPPGPGGIYRSKVFPGLWLDGEALFAEDRRRLIQVLGQGIATPEHAAFVAKLAKARERAGDAR